MEEVNQIDRTKGQWYIVQVLSGQERRVLSRLKGKIKEADGDVPVHEVLIPMEIVSEIRQGKKQKSQPKIIFPGYVYVRMDLYKEDGTLDEPSWFFVKDVQGVINFLGGRLGITERDPLHRRKRFKRGTLHRPQPAKRRQKLLRLCFSDSLNNR